LLCSFRLTNTDRFRDGIKAIELAKKAVRLNPNIDFFDTLAAAYAEAYRFEDAIKTQEKAIALISKESSAKNTDELNERLKFYKAHKPWREP
jgi:tetratricopeptide (TPR) repeat protein